jgi:type II secretory pathway component GspD/PulD (secretin)
MNKLKYVILVFCSILAAVSTCNGDADTQQAKPESEQNSAPAADSDNPFASFFSNRKTTTQKISLPAVQIEEKPELFLQSVTLKFLDARNLANTISNMSSQYGEISVDTKSNSLIICDTNDVIQKILSEIKKTDKPPQQLMIETVIVDVQLDDDTEIGINWDILSDKMYDISYRQNLGNRLSMIPATAENIADTTAYNTISDAGVVGGYLAIISGTVRNAVHLLQEKRNVEILASPRVMVVSGESASIETVTEIPYREVMQTSEGGELSSTQFKKVGVKLNVTAVLTDDNYILVTLEPEQSVDTGVFGTESQVPIIDTRKAKTTLLLKDGQVVIMGGLRKKETTNQVSQIPIVGDLPLVGMLFRNTQKTVKNSELLVFMSPHIYKGEPVSQEQRERFDILRNKPPLVLPKEQNDNIFFGDEQEKK